MRGHSWVELTEHDNGAADIMVHNMVKTANSTVQFNYRLQNHTF